MSDALRLRATRTVLPTADGRHRVTPASVVVSQGRITAVDAHDAEGSEPVHDLGDRLLAPAFIDAHTHLALVGLRGLDMDAGRAHNVVEDVFFEVERRLDAADVAALVRVGAYEALLHGTAVVFDHYYHPQGVLDGLDAAGLIGVVAPALQDIAGPGVPLWEHHLQATHDLATDPTVAARGHAIAVGPHASDTVSDGLWRRIVALADRLDLPVHGHLAQSIEEVRRAAARVGGTPLDVLAHAGALEAGVRLLLVHGLYLTDADLARLDPHRHTLAVCPSSQSQFHFVAPVAAWQAAGVPWVVATDCQATNDSADLSKELRQVGALRVGDVTGDHTLGTWRGTGRLADAERVAAARTRRWNGRAALGDPSVLLGAVWDRPGSVHPALPAGRIAPGTWAHLAVYEVDHPSFWPGTDPLRVLAFGNPSPALHGLMIRGHWRTEPGRHAETLLHEPGWREARTEATERLRRLLRH